MRRRSSASLALSFALFAASCATARALELIELGDAAEAPRKDAPLPDGALAKSACDVTLSKVALSPDGRRAATASGDGKVRIWDAANAKLLKTLAAHESECDDVCFARDGASVFSASADRTVRQWDIETGKELRKFDGHEGEAKSVACSPDGLRLASSDAKGIRIWDLKSGRQLHLLTGHKVPQEAVAAVAGIIEPVSLTIDALVFAPDGRTLVSEANDETARIWDALTGRELRLLPQHDGANAAVALSPDGGLGVSTRGALNMGATPRLRIWEVATGRVLRTLVGHADNIQCDAFSPDGRYILSGSRDRTIRQWEVDTGVEVRRFCLASMPLSVAYAPDGKSAVSVSASEGLVIWDLSGPPRAPLWKAEYKGGQQFVARQAARTPAEAAAADIATLDDAWGKLASLNYIDRTLAVHYYLKQGAAAVADLRKRTLVPSADAASGAARAALIARLDDPDYAARQKAHDDLAQLGETARSELVAALDDPSAEVRSRAGSLLNAIGGVADFRRILVVEILALLKTPEATAELERLAKSGLPCAAHAKALLARAGK